MKFYWPGAHDSLYTRDDNPIICVTGICVCIYSLEIKSKQKIGVPRSLNVHVVIKKSFLKINIR